MRRRLSIAAAVLLTLGAGVFAAGNAMLARRANDRGKACPRSSECAVREFAEAVRFRPGDARYHYNLGIALFEVGRDDHAALELQQALRLDPGHDKASRALTDVMTRIRDRAADQVVAARY